MDEFTCEGRKVRVHVKQVSGTCWDWSYSIDDGPMVWNREDMERSRAAALDEAKAKARAEIRRMAQAAREARE